MNKKNNKYNHINEEQRGIIRDKLYSGASANEIAEELGVSHTTITREVKRNRVEKIPNIRTANPALYCEKFQTCGIQMELCQNCMSPYTHCKKCVYVKCYTHCKNFKIIKCPETEKWPYICLSTCPKRKSCRFPKYAYAPIKAQKFYKERLVETRSGANITDEDLKKLESMISPLIIENGQSPYAAIQACKDDLAINERTLYRYIEQQLIRISSLDLPRKASRKQRSNCKSVFKDKINREGHTYQDFLNLSQEDKNRVFEMDSVEGFKWNKQRIVTLHKVNIKFQLLCLVPNGKAESVVWLFNYIEITLGSRELFEKIFGIILADRGKEFNFFLQLEMSILEPGQKRCRVYFCDPQRSDQKGSCEKNHEFIRYVLPKGQSNFDALTNYDIAVLNSHINSYPRKLLDGITPLKEAEKIIPKSFFDDLGIETISPKEVILKPKLLKHTQC